MIKRLSQYDIINALWEDKNNSFTYEACKALAEYLDSSDFENEEFDRVAIRSEYSYYEDYLELNEDLALVDSKDLEDLEDSEKEELIKEELGNNTFFIDFKKGIILRNF